LDAVTYKLNNLRSSVESWFDNAMDRASGVYKRNTVGVLALIALVLTVASGADSINFVARPYVDSALRTQLANQTPAAQPDVSASMQKLEPFATLFGYSDFPGLNDSVFPRWLVVTIAGELITSFALLLGAPFWFDLLTQLANLRVTGPPPASASDAQRATAKQGATT
jgi:hypothetical protein